MKDDLLDLLNSPVSQANYLYWEAKAITLEQYRDTIQRIINDDDNNDKEKDDARYNH